MKFFERFESLARKNGTSPNAVAKELGISSGSVTAWKNGTAPSINKAIQLAEHFNVPTDYLLGIDRHTSNDSLSQERKQLEEKIMRLSAEDVDKALEYVEMLEMKRRHQER
ncbi:MAG: helix-turn-helix domain-containing protein [Oscillospiraceae bacterium]|nr:helix-turn-helix domain-containing protein [Oscillospiraceae bacterium]